MCRRGYKKLYRIDLGKTDYRNAWHIQKQLVELRCNNRIPDCIIFTEHNPVITMGRATDKKHLLVSLDELEARGVDLFEVERGGDITFHGPGQSVVYPIVDLNNWGRDVHRYLRDLEKFVIDSLNDLGLKTDTREGLTGIWAGDYKVCAIGVAASRWITYHGLALNVNTDLDYFRLITPCGIAKYKVGTISELLQEEIDLQKVNELLTENFVEMFYYEAENIDNVNSLLEDTEKKQIKG